MHGSCCYNSFTAGATIASKLASDAAWMYIGTASFTETLHNVNVTALSTWIREDELVNQFVISQGLKAFAASLVTHFDSICHTFHNNTVTHGHAALNSDHSIDPELFS